MKAQLKINVITGWNDNRVESKTVECNPVSTTDFFDDSLFGKYSSGDSGPSCGNSHAGKGVLRIISNGIDTQYITQEEIQKAVNLNIHELGERILISAGHYMPIKNNFSQVNSNSTRSLLQGIYTLKSILQVGHSADLLITLNDVTVNSNDEKNDALPTMSAAERSAFYDKFLLPDVYISSLLDLKNSFDGKFKVYVIGENRLSEKLSRDATYLVSENYFFHPDGRNSYALNMQKDKLFQYLRLAHGSNVDIGKLYNLETPIFISNEKGIKGRPKCVRACTRLAALPYEMNYTGFIQFLPVCSRNALEGFLIGTDIYSRKFKKKIPYVSVHNVFSCF